MKFSKPIFWICILLLFGCKSKKVVVNNNTEDIPEVVIEERILDSLLITAPRLIEKVEEYKLPTYNPSFTRVHDLIHTNLDLRFDWKKEQVIGKATLTLEPLFYSSNTLTLDAKDFVFNKVLLTETNQPLTYEYDGEQIIIDLGKNFKNNEPFKIFIDYVASPSKSGGSEAITSNKGLFFINPRNEEPGKPMQIWTQGETEWNSRWFPTIDKPNERCTQEIHLTVQDRFKTLSNGLLLSSKKNPDGTRTDYWKMNQPHAPYLFMIAVGEFAVIKDDWRGKPVEYFVEKKYKKDARAIFSNTLSMLDFFSEKIGVEYPWDKYAQIVVRDYVSGAMENTTSVVFGDFVQRNERELLDGNNEYIVAHEMFHHWFGNYVTCESWANLTMNEGFANYSEYLWFEHKYGTDLADYHRRSELQGYFNSTVREMHPLIHFGFEDKEQMFDAHSYNKGGLVLHMLRNLIGDEAFFASLNNYLTTNAYSAVEAHDLRLAVEEITGKDWNWFFNQWFFEAGHPFLAITHEYDKSAKLASVTIEQKQDVEKSIPIFRLPYAIDVYDENGKRVRHHVEMTKRKQTFTFESPIKPKLVDVDAERVLLAEFQEEHTQEEYIFQYLNCEKFIARYEALEALQDFDNSAVEKVFIAALDDPFWYIRMRAIPLVNIDQEDISLKNKVAQIATSDEKSHTRTAAIKALGKTGDKSLIPIFKKAILYDSSYSVIVSSIITLYQLDKEEGLAIAKKIENDKNSNIILAVGEIYSETGNPKFLSFLRKNGMSWKATI